MNENQVLILFKVKFEVNISFFLNNKLRFCYHLEPEHLKITDKWWLVWQNLKEHSFWYFMQYLLKNSSLGIHYHTHTLQARVKEGRALRGKGAVLTFYLGPRLDQSISFHARHSQSLPVSLLSSVFFFTCFFFFLGPVYS